MENTACIEMPKYRCFKTVWALKIKKVEEVADGGGLITPEDERYAAFNVDAEYMVKHQPGYGGYYVLYKGGYKSYSPADAFEEGYSLITKDDIVEDMKKGKTATVNIGSPLLSQKDIADVAERIIDLLNKGADRGLTIDPRVCGRATNGG